MMNIKLGATTICELKVEINGATCHPQLSSQTLTMMKTSVLDKDPVACRVLPSSLDYIGLP